MTFDDRLQRAVDTLGDTLREHFRDDLTRELHSLLDDWKAAIPPAPAPEPQLDAAALIRLADALRTMDSATSLSEILNELAIAAGNESARAGVFLVRGARDEAELRSFRLVGFPPKYDDTPIVMPLNQAGVLRDAVEQRVGATSVTSPFDAPMSDPLPEGGGAVDGVDAIALPIVLAGAAVGALYAEGAVAPAMDILTRFASRALEAMTALKTARAIAEAGA